MGEPVREKDQRPSPHLKEATEQVVPAREVVLAPAAAKDVAVRAPGAVEAVV